MTATNCKAHPLGCRCRAMPQPAQSRRYWRLPSYVPLNVDRPALPPARTGALDQLVTRIQTARRAMRRPT